MKSYFTGLRYSNDEEKRQAVLEVIKPICSAFGITEYDYVINRAKHIERLVIEGQAIGCMCNSIGAVVTELVNYIWINIYVENRDIGHFQTQTLNVLKQYWIKGE